MTEKPEKKEDWKAEMTEIVNKAVKEALKSRQDKPKSAAGPPGATEDKHEHWKAEDINDTCPECKTELEKIGRKYAEKLLKERKNMQYHCEGCGLPVQKEEEKCPVCGSTKAR